MAQESRNRDQGAAGCKQSDRTALCANNCGLLGSPATLHMCSACYKSHVAGTMRAAATSSASPASPPRSASSANRETALSPARGILIAVNARNVDLAPERESSSEASSPIAAARAVAGAAASTGTMRLTSFSPRAGPATSALGERAHARPAPHPVSQTPSNPAADAIAAAAPPLAATAHTCLPSWSPPSPSPPPVRANRCASCRRRVGLTGFKCRCGHTFCASHRYSDKHECSFDYKAAGRESIARDNPVVKADKVVRF